MIGICDIKDYYIFFHINLDIEVSLMFAVLSMPHRLVWANVSIMCF